MYLLYYCAAICMVNKRYSFNKKTFLKQLLFQAIEISRACAVVIQGRVNSASMTVKLDIVICVLAGADFRYK